ncbi:MAG: prolipoprotein diacylglyceryl transferase family protein [Patescibacteria group bacterium]
MVPYFHYTVIHIGFIPIQVWGLMVALGIYFATRVAAKKAKQDGLDPNIVWDFAFWVIVGAFVGARLFQIIYFPDLYLKDPLELLKFWQGGFSEMGGFVGAIIVLLFYFRKHKIAAMRYADCAAYGLPLGFGIGRIGCFLIHDHPGTLTHFILGVKYPDGVRHDHGLYLSIEGFLLFVLFVFLARKKQNAGTFVIAFLILHGTIRFLLDYLRIGDARYFSLTPAQYVSIGMVFAGIWIMKKNHFQNLLFFS